MTVIVKRLALVCRMFSLAASTDFKRSTLLMFNVKDRNVSSLFWVEFHVDMAYFLMQHWWKFVNSRCNCPIQTDYCGGQASMVDISSHSMQNQLWFIPNLYHLIIESPKWHFRHGCVDEILTVD